MDVALTEADAVRVVHLHGAEGALVDLALVHRDAVAVGGFDAQDAAAVEAAALQPQIAAALEVQHAAGAFAGLLRVSRREAPQLDVAAGAEGEHVGVAGDCGEHGGLRIRRFRRDRQAADVPDHQLRAVPALLPEEVLALRGAVAGSGAQVVASLRQEDGAVGTDGGKELVDAADFDLSARRDLRGRRDGDGGPDGIRIDLSVFHQREGFLRKLASLRILRRDTVVSTPDPAAGPGGGGVVAEGAAVHRGAVLVAGEAGGAYIIVPDRVGEEAGVFVGKGIQQHLGAVAVDARVTDREAVGIGGVEQAEGHGAARLGPAAVHVAVFHPHVPAGIGFHRAAAAFIDLG